MDTGNVILSACGSYLYALCPNDRVTPFPSTAMLQQFLDEIVEASDPARVEAVLKTAHAFLRIPEKHDLERAERASGSLRSIIDAREARRREKLDHLQARDDDDDVRIG